MKICVLDALTLGSDISLEPIEQLGEVKIYPLTKPDQLLERLIGIDVIVTNKVELREEVLSQLPDLKLIALTATGFNNVDIEYAKKVGIGVANVGGYSTKSVAQHTFAILFQLLEQLSFHDTYIKDKCYMKEKTFKYIGRPFYEINGKRWGIIGMGAIGKDVAKIAEAFGCEVVYYSTSGKNNSVDYERLSFEELLKSSDIISIHAPLNEQTKNLITYKEMRYMKSSAILLNLGRGMIVDEIDLAKALNEQLIRGAALDVLAKEPIDQHHPFYQVDASKWLVTPHIGWASVEARTRLIKEVANNIEKFRLGIIHNRIV